MKRKFIFTILILCLPNLSFAVERIETGILDPIIQCSRLLDAFPAASEINNIIDAVNIPDENPQKGNSNPLWFLEAGHDPLNQPVNHIKIQAIALDTEFGVGTNIFYPFGGIDVVTASNSPSVQTIYSAQLEPFGNIIDGLHMLGHSPFSNQIADLSATLFDAIALGWISSGTLKAASQLTHGLGLHSLMVIRKLMRAKILSVGYLDFKNGVWSERSLAEPTENLAHGFIEFEYQGRVIKYFLLQADLSDASTTNQLELLLKGKKFDSILRHIHGAQNRLHSNFSGLLRLLNESQRIFTTGPEEEPYSSFPNHEVVLEHDRISTWAPYFGTHGALAILLRRSAKTVELDELK